MNKLNQDIEMKKQESFGFTGFILFLLVTILISACENEEHYQFEDTPIITGYLYAGQYFKVQVSHQVPFEEDLEYTSDNINNLSIMLIILDSVIWLDAEGDGNYSATNLIVTEGDEYEINFDFNEKDVAAYTYVPTKPVDVTQSVTVISIERMDSTWTPSPGSMPEPIEITWENNDQSYYLAVVENMEEELDPIREIGDDEDIPERRFRNAPTNDNSLQIRSMDFQYYGQHRIVLYHVLPDYASLYELSESTSQNITNPSTSITNGYGIFTGLNSDTLYLTVNEI